MVALCKGFPSTRDGPADRTPWSGDAVMKMTGMGPSAAWMAVTAAKPFPDLSLMSLVMMSGRLTEAA